MWIRSAVAVLLLTASLFGAQCGTERWKVKVLRDSDAANVRYAHVVNTTIAKLVSRASPSRASIDAHSDSRFPVEKFVVRVHANLVAFKKETDSDLHLVLSDGKNTMVGEIPLASCALGGEMSASKMSTLGFMSYTQSRAAVEQMAGHATAKLKRLAKPIAVIVTGVAFYDFAHGQDGVAKNAIELHPVLRIEESK